MQLTDPKTVKQLLNEFRAEPTKALGQNFLVSEKVLQELVDAAGLTENDVVVEPGAGIGTVTIELAKRARYVLAYELDRRLIPILKRNLNPSGLAAHQGAENVEVCNEDVLEAFRKGNPNPSGLKFDRRVKIVGSIPYSITSPLIHEIVYYYEQIESATLIIQKEVAEKIVATPPQASYLSNFVQLFAEIKLVEKSIPPSAFLPEPEVHSAILKLRSKVEDLGIRPKEWSEFLHRGFSQPRKMLRKVFDEKLVTETGINLTARPQQLSLPQWQALFLLQAKQ